MDISKKDTKMAQGVAILTMVAGHLFAKKGEDVYGTPLIWVKPDVPLIYYLGFLSGICICFYCYCTGYSLFMQYSNMEFKAFLKRTYFRLLKFLIQFWLVCIIFSIVGLFFDKYGDVPYSIGKFLRNFFLFEHTYNGAWWFTSTYVAFIFLCPLYLKLAKKADSRILFILFAFIFCVYYVCNMKHMFSASPEDYYWTGFLLRKLSDIWYLSFFYIVGMLFAKEQIMSKIRQWMNNTFSGHHNLYILIVVGIVSLVACLVEMTVSVFFLSIFYFICFILWEKGERTEKFFLFFGKHSTNIWLVHMFFYLFIFKDFVFIVRYPVFIYIFMMCLCIPCSYIINFIVKMIWKTKPFKRLESWGNQ